MTEKISAADDLSTVVISEIKEEVTQERLINEQEILQNSKELLKLSQELCSDPSNSETAAKIINFVGEYSEMPQLLDSVLSDMIKNFTEICLKYFDRDFPESIYCCIHVLSNIRGFRELLPLFPNEVAMFEPVAEAYQRGSQRWEVRYVLLLWLAQLALVPFDIASKNSEKRMKLVDDIINKSTEILSSPAKDSESSAFFLSRFLLRKDMIEKRDIFIHAAFDSFSSSQERLITGYMRTLFFMLTSFDRLWVLPFADELLEKISPLGCIDEDTPKTQPVSSHHQLYCMKIIQQLGISLLPPRVAPWRYQRGCRTLKIGEEGHQQANKATETDEEYKNDEEFEVPEEVNTILGILFGGLRNSLTVVRWSAAKGVSRIVERLPYSFAKEAIDFTLNAFNEVDDYNFIHGASLCLAEFTLRGSLLPSVLLEAMPLIMNALIYDVQLGSHTVAENVRDSGCFVCWAIARSYDGAHIENVCLELAQQLVNVFLFDRSVNVRRSASAAFQENVGRHGRFPHGLELIHVADFLSVSSRVGCYKRIAPFIAQFPAYGPSIVKHLATNRIQHWDEEIRLLAAQSLSIIAVEHKELITQEIISEVCDCCTSYDIDVKQGGLEALGSLLWVMDIELPLIKHLLDLPDACQSDNIKCSFIKMLSAAAKRKIETPNLPQVLNDWLISESDVVQKSAIESLKFLNNGEERYLNEDFYENLLTQISKPGVALSLVAFPIWYLQPNIDKIIAKISELLVEGGDREMIVTKCNLVDSMKKLSQFCSNETIVKILKQGLNDRTMTKKGDEGSSVRSMSLKVCLLLLPNDFIAKQLTSDVVYLNLDRISGIRDYGLKVLAKFVETTPDLQHREQLMFTTTENGSDFKYIAELIDIDEYAEIVVQGLILCGGAYAPDLSQRASNGLLHYMRTKDAPKVASIVNVLFKKLRCDVNFTNSLLAFVPKILNEGILGTEALNDFATKYLVTMEAFLKKQFFRKFMAAAPSLAWLSILCKGEIKKKSFSLFAPFFVSEYPVVRDKSATELSQALELTSVFADDDEDEDEINTDEAQEVLENSAWKTDFDQCAEGCKKLCALFNVEVPVIEKKEAPTTQNTRFTYQNLVKSSY